MRLWIHPTVQKKTNQIVVTGHLKLIICMSVHVIAVFFCVFFGSEMDWPTVHAVLIDVIHSGAFSSLKQHFW